MFHVTKQQLIDIGHLGLIWNYNRQIDPEKIEANVPEGLYPVTFVMPHFHRFGSRCEKHWRLFIQISETVTVTADVPTEYLTELGVEVRATADAG